MWDYISLLVVALILQLFRASEMLLTEALDQGLSIAILLLVIIAFTLHYVKDRKYWREVIKGLSDRNDEKTIQYIDLLKKNTKAIEQQSRTNNELRKSNKDLRDAVLSLQEKI